MSRLFYHVMQDNAGNLLFDVSGTMRLAGTGTAANIYGDEAMTIPIANPMTNHPSFGSFKCYLAPGSYDFYMAKSGYTFETLTGVQGLGTMAIQNASAVAVSGTLAVTGETTLSGRVAIGNTMANNLSATVKLDFNKATYHGLMLRPADSDAATAYPIIFVNTGAIAIGSISTTAAATSYNTSSDARLKHAIAPLTGALDVVQALRPVHFRWRSDDSEGRGFVASEVADVVDGVITGDRDAVDAEGNILPQMIDMSKLVPWLVGACQELAQQVQALTARLEAAGA